MGIDIKCETILKALMEYKSQKKPSDDLAEEPQAVQSSLVHYELKEDYIRSSKSYEKACAIIIDVQLDAYRARLRRFGLTGKQFIDDIFNTRIRPALSAGQHLVLVFDNSVKVPKCKHPTQSARTANSVQIKQMNVVNEFGNIVFVKDKEPMLVDIRFGDEFILPGQVPLLDKNKEYVYNTEGKRKTVDQFYQLLSTRNLRAKLIRYMIQALYKKINVETRANPSLKGIVYVSLPKLSEPIEVSVGDEELPLLLSGAFAELTRTGAQLPNESVHGEGDMICKIWSDFFGETLCKTEAGIGKAVVVVSIDKDMLGIYACSRSSAPVLLHITNDKEKGFGFLNVKTLWEDVFNDSENRAQHFALALVLGKSDYCEGVRGISGERILRTALGLRAGKTGKEANSSFFQDQLMVKGDITNPEILERRMINVLKKASHLKDYNFRQPYMLRRAAWNILYWSNLQHMVPPYIADAWRINMGKYVPIDDKAWTDNQDKKAQAKKRNNSGQIKKK